MVFLPEYAVEGALGFKAGLQPDIGDGAIIGASSVVGSDVAPYTIVVGNPARILRKRFDDEFIAYLLDLKWWDWDIEKIEANFEALSSGDLTLIKKIVV